MIPEIGTFALVLALLVALVQGTLPLIGAQRGVAAWVALARPASATLFLLIAIAFGCLTAAFIGNDFSVLYVAQHSNSRLPLEYRIAGVWGGHEGSLLLWVLMLSLWGMAVAALSRSLETRSNSAASMEIGFQCRACFSATSDSMVSSSAFECAPTRS